MNTQNRANENFENLTEGQIKQLALMQHLGEDYFFCPDGIAYVGNYDESYNDFLADIEGTEEVEIDANFSIYCSNNLTAVEEYDTDSYNNDYLVLTDEEADEKAAEYIKDSLWAFNASFLACETGFPIEVFTALQDQCEGANDAIFNLVDGNKSDTDIDSFIESAISADGRGHFMSSYDGNENEENVNGTTYYIYSIN